MNKICYLLFFFTLVSFSQEQGFYRIFLNNGESIDAKKISVLKNRINYESSDGVSSYVESYKVIHTRFVSDLKEKFEYKDKILNTSIVYKIDGLSAQEIFTRAKNWVITNYKNPDEVLKGVIENQFLKFTGYSSIYEINYSISISVKEGRYKFDVLNIYKRLPPTPTSVHNELSLLDISGLYNNKGKIYNMWKQFPFQAEDTLNEISESLFKYIKEDGEKLKSDW